MLEVYHLPVPWDVHEIVTGAINTDPLTCGGSRGAIAAVGHFEGASVQTKVIGVASLPLE